MIVRTYGRRNRGVTRTFSDTTATIATTRSNFSDEIIDIESDDQFRDSLLSQQENSSQEFYNGIPFSSGDSSNWGFDSEPQFGHNSSQTNNSLLGFGGELKNGERKSKKARNGTELVSIGSVIPVVATKTLMETQEFGEMIEHFDEVNFALDGLKKGQPTRIRRASLLSLLSISSTVQQRRLLRTEGMARTIIDAILDLSFDDPPSNLAAVALFYVLTNEGQDDQRLESPRSIRFLLNLLKPQSADASQVKARSIGSKLIGLRKNGDILRDSAKGSDFSSVSIAQKVQEILVNCKDLKSSVGDDNGKEKPELTSKWVALLTLERACMSTISLEDTSGSIRKNGGSFKEKVRELGGLDAVFDVALDCHADIEGWLEDSKSLIRESKDHGRSLVLLLKCLKIMENATFLSSDNQSHLLQMKGNHQGSRMSFIRLMISSIKILSGLSLLKSSPTVANKASSFSQESIQGSELLALAEEKEYKDDTLRITSFKPRCSSRETLSEKSFGITRNSQWLSTSGSGYSKTKSEATSSSLSDTCLLKTRASSSKSSSSSGTVRSSLNIMSIKESGSRKNVGFNKKQLCFVEDVCRDILEDSQDPFAFDLEDFQPSNWELLSGKPKVSRAKQHREPCREVEDEYEFKMTMSQQESSNDDSQKSCPATVNEEKGNLIADCLLTAVKVLMNLTNDNPIGCQLIASSGGLETMSSLIACHFPSFTSPPSSSPFEIEDDDSFLSKSISELDQQPSDRHLNDQELDFLVAILGLLVNLVEKDGRNRSRLAAASVSLPSSKLVEKKSNTDVIPLLCSIFLANQGAGEAAGEGKAVPQNDEEAVLQGEKEAEKMIIEAYSALLLAFLSTESKDIRDAITNCLPQQNLTVVVPVLERFVEFHLSLNMISPETHIAVSEVIESCRIR